MTGKLTAIKVQKAGPGRYGDGNGLYLEVDASGAKRWMLRTVIHGRRRDMGLGSASLVPLKDARDLAVRYRRIARDGGDPIAERARERRVTPTFAEAARTVHKERIAGSCGNPKHVMDWLSSVERYAFPHIGSKQVQHITEADVLRVLKPIWMEKPETARRVHQRIKVVMDWSRAHGFREAANPADSVTEALPRQNDRTKHFDALPWREMPDFWKRLDTVDGMGVKALRFAILTAARSGEVRGATWDEIDLTARTWTVPPERMKAKREHRVPLSDEAVAIIEGLPRLYPSPYLFPSRRGGLLSDMTLSKVLRTLEVPATVHGFRSTFRVWAEEETSTPHEVKEAALAHAAGDKTERAYNRSDLFEKRRGLMEAWGRFVVRGGAQVLRLSA